MSITDAIDTQLARLRTRYARTPLPRFFAWWGRELVALFAGALARVDLAERSDALLLEAQGRRADGAGAIRRAARANSAASRSLNRSTCRRRSSCVCASSSTIRICAVSIAFRAERTLRRMITFCRPRRKIICARCSPSRWIGRRRSRPIRSISTIASRSRSGGSQSADRTRRVPARAARQRNQREDRRRRRRARRRGLLARTGRAVSAAGLNLLPPERRAQARESAPAHESRAGRAAAMVLLITVMLTVARQPRNRRSRR